MIKAIVFDYFGVISSDEYWGYVGADKQADSTFHDLAERVNLGSLSWTDFLASVAKQAGKSAKDIQDLYESQRINAAVVAFASELHQHYKTALLSNAHHDYLEPRLAAAHLDTVFDAVVISSRVGLIKPDPGIYLLVLEKLGVEPGQAIMIDDTPAQVAGAEAVGMSAIHYEDLDQLKRDLGKLLDA